MLSLYLYIMGMVTMYILDPFKEDWSTADYVTAALWPVSIPILFAYFFINDWLIPTFVDWLYNDER